MSLFMKEKENWFRADKIKSALKAMPMARANIACTSRGMAET
jgi:hypothetical protein